jgi:hypothetical protein
VIVEEAGETEREHRPARRRPAMELGDSTPDLLGAIQALRGLDQHKKLAISREFRMRNRAGARRG